MEQAIDVLAKPDVTVTNQKDKVVQLGKLRTIDSMVKDAAEVQKLRRKESDRNATRGLRHGPIGSAVERESAGGRGSKWESKIFRKSAKRSKERSQRSRRSSEEATGHSALAGLVQARSVQPAQALMSRYASQTVLSGAKKEERFSNRTVSL